MAQRIQLQHKKIFGGGRYDRASKNQRALNHYVNTVLCAENPPDPPDPPDHPADCDLKNHIYKAKRALELSKLDQHNFKLKLQEWESSHPDLTFYL